MNKQKIAELAMKLEQLVEQEDGTETVSISVKIYKNQNRSGDIEVRKSKFMAHDYPYDSFNWQTEIGQEEMVDGISFKTTIFKAVPKDDKDEL